MTDSSVNLRRPKESDITEIEDIAKQYSFPLVDKFETAAVTENEHGLTAFGVTRTILEAVLYCKGRPRDRVLALRKLMDRAIEDAKTLGFDQVYVFVEPEFAIILKKFGFRDAIGVPLVLDLEKKDV